MPLGREKFECSGPTTTKSLLSKGTVNPWMSRPVSDLVGFDTTTILKLVCGFSLIMVKANVRLPRSPARLLCVGSKEDGVGT